MAHDRSGIAVRVCISLLGMLFVASHMAAQSDTTVPSTEQQKAEREYAETLGRVQHGDMSVDFRAFRVAGALKSGPHASMLEAKERAAFRSIAASGDWMGALELAKRALDRNYASLVAHSDAMAAYQAMGKADEAGAHEKILNALLDSIHQSGDGKSPETAYFVVTVQEEYIFLNRVLNVRAKSQDWVRKDGHFYDRLAVPDSTTNQVGYLWFNADFDARSDPAAIAAVKDGVLATTTVIRPGADPALPPAGARSMDAPDPMLVSTLDSLKKSLLSAGPIEWSFSYSGEQRVHRMWRTIAAVAALPSTCQVRMHFDDSSSSPEPRGQVASLFLESIDTVEVKSLQEVGNLLGTRLRKPNFVTYSAPAVYNIIINGHATMILFLDEKQATDAADAIHRSAQICQSAPLKMADTAAASNLGDSLGFIKEKLADNGAVDYRSVNQYPTGSRADTYSTRISNVIADTATCQIHFDQTRRVNGGLTYYPPLMDTTGDGKETISLRRVARADVRPAQNSIPQVYTLFLTMSDGTSTTGLPFDDRQIADQLAKAMLRAAGLCNGGRKDSNDPAAAAARQSTGSDSVSPVVDPSPAQGSAASPLTGPRISYPVLSKRVQPEYTPEARASDLQGSVVVYLEVGPTGDVENTQVIQSLGLGLDENAVAAVKQWRFKPGTTDGMPAKMAQSAEVTFSLDHSNSWQIRRSGYRVNRTEADQVAQLTKPMLNQYVSPAPEACRADGDVVVVTFQITKAGKPERVKIIEQRGEDASAATLKAIPLWRFQPGLLNGKPREASASIEMECRASATTASISETSGGSYRVGAGVSAPVILYKVEPEYSAEARRAKFQGTVAMTFQVDTSGHPINIRMVRSLGLGLDVKAMEALNQWRFRPGAKDGKPVSVFGTVEVSFRLL